jgi:hypothetical protein
MTIQKTVFLTRMKESIYEMRVCTTWNSTTSKEKLMAKTYSIIWTPNCEIVLGCKIPHELDVLKWKAIGGGRRRRIWTPNQDGSLVFPSLTKFASSRGAVHCI